MSRKKASPKASPVMSFIRASEYREKRYCPFCGQSRSYYLKKHLNLMDVLSCLMASLFLMLTIWQDFDPRFLALFVVFLAFSETFVMIRWRLKLNCDICGFDPILYKKDPKKMAEWVKAYMEAQKNNPSSLLKPKPNLKPIKKKATEPRPKLEIQN